MQVADVPRDSLGDRERSGVVDVSALVSDDSNFQVERGCGAGIDTILAARRAGRGIGLDFVLEMLERTQAAAAAAGLGNVETVEGEIEAIPLADDSVDHVISNGVINLSARKARVLAECARVLRPGGRLTVSDLTVENEEQARVRAEDQDKGGGAAAAALHLLRLSRRFARPEKSLGFRLGVKE